MVGTTGCTPPGPQTLSLLFGQLVPMLMGAPPSMAAKGPPAPGFQPQYPPPPTRAPGQPLTTDKVICQDASCARVALGRPRRQVPIDLGRGGARTANDAPGTPAGRPLRRTTKTVAQAEADLAHARAVLKSARNGSGYSRSRHERAAHAVREAEADLEAARARARGANA